MVAALAIANYRSLRDVVLPLAPLNIVTGPNGSGKSSVYRALRLLAEVAQGGAVASLAREGGFASTLWAGPENITAAMRRGEVPVQGTVRKGRSACDWALPARAAMRSATPLTWACRRPNLHRPSTATPKSRPK